MLLFSIIVGGLVCGWVAGVGDECVGVCRERCVCVCVCVCVGKVAVCVWGGGCRE